MPSAPRKVAPLRSVLPIFTLDTDHESIPQSALLVQFVELQHLHSTRLHPISTMPITILPPAPAAPMNYQHNTPDNEDDSFDSEGDVDMEATTRASKRSRLSQKAIVTPGEVITDDPQWMRCNPPSHPDPPPS